MPSTPQERRIAAQAAAHASWANTPDRKARTAATEAAFRKFEDQVDPNRELPAAERRQRAEHLRQAHLARAALKSLQVRRKAAEVKKLAAEAEALARDAYAAAGTADT